MVYCYKKEGMNMTGRALALITAVFTLMCALAAADAGFLALTGLDRMADSIRQGAQLSSAYYTDGTREFETRDAAEAQQLYEALSEISIASFSGQRDGEGFTAIIFSLTDGSRYSVRFAGERLEAGNTTYDVQGAETFRMMAQAILQGRTGQSGQTAGGTVNAVDLYLPCTPSTGYSWSAAAEREGIVRITGQYFEGDASGRTAGAGGTQWFHFDGVAPGMTAVTLAYSRPWESNAAYTLNCRMTVDSALNVLTWGIEMQAP